MADFSRHPSSKDRSAWTCVSNRDHSARGKRVQLHGLGSEEGLEITGIEMLRDPLDQNVVRILCSKPETLVLPTGKVRGWLITEP